MEWFYAEGDRRMGPVASVDFQNAIARGAVRPETLVWSATMTEWQPYAKVEPETAVCAASGGRYWKRDMVPYEGKFISAEHKEQYFQRLREGVTQPGVMVYAGFWIRAVARVIDVIIYAFAFGIVFGLFGALFFGAFLNPAKMRNDPSAIGMVILFEGIFFLAVFVIVLAYESFFLTRFGATPGKMALGIRVVRSDGGKITLGRAIGRILAERLSGMLLYIGYIIAAFDNEKRALHDHICDTRVIKAK